MLGWIQMTSIGTNERHRGAIITKKNQPGSRRASDPGSARKMPSLSGNQVGSSSAGKEG
jgi:hypothetical protein